MTTPPVPPRPSYSTAYVARRLGVSIPTVQRWVDSGHLKAWKTVGGHRRIDAQSAEVLFQANPAAAGPARASMLPSVMVVDDNPDDRDLLSALVEQALPGAEVTLAENGFQALVAIGQQAPDVLITDILMPHMSGLEMLRNLSSHCAVRPRVLMAVSSLTPEDLARQGELPSDVAFERKPLEPETFIASLRSAWADANE